MTSPCGDCPNGVRRGTLQEELNNVIADEIQKATGSSNVGVTYKQHMVVVKTEALVFRSLTQTITLCPLKTWVLKEFMDNIKLQQEFHR